MQATVQVGHVLLLQNVQQGPCSITQLHAWLAALAGRPDLDEAYQQFKAISVWTVRLLPLFDLGSANTGNLSLF